MDNTLKNLARVAGINSGIAVPGFDISRNKNTAIAGPVTAEANGQTYVSSVPYAEYTVGPGKDFERIDDACRWLLEQPVPAYREIKFLLADNMTHVMGETGFVIDPEGIGIAFAVFAVTAGMCVSFYKDGAPLYSPGGPDTCIITVAKDVVDNMYLTPFAAMGGSKIFLFNVTIDIAADGGTPQWCNGAVGTEGGQIGMSFCTLKNCNYGMDASINGYGMLANMAFSGNVADTSIPLREIQYDGSVISDTGGALFFKA